MVERKALVLNNGAIQELPTGDTLTGAGGGAGDGLPTGGTTGQQLIKTDATDYNAEWANRVVGTNGDTYPGCTVQLIDVEVGNWVSASMMGEGGGINLDTNENMAEDRMLLASLILPFDVTFDQIGFFCRTADALVTFRMAVYEADTSDLTQANLLYESAAISCATTGTKTETITGNLTLTKGTLYYIGGVAHGGDLNTYAVGRANAPGFGYTAPNQTQVTNSLYKNNISDVLALNDPITGLARGQNPKAPHVLLRMLSGNDATPDYLDLDNFKVSIEESTGTNYDTVLADFAGNIVQKLNNAAANTVTVTPGLAATEPCTFMQTGAGATSFVAGTGVTINSLDGNLTLAGQYASATLIPDGLNNYHLLGALIA